MFKLLKVSDRGAMANQWQIDALVKYDGEPASIVTFVGTPYGNPGPVVMCLAGAQYPVDSPARYGEKFGTDWVRNFYREGNDDE